MAQLVKNHLQYRRLRFDSWVGKIYWRRDRLPIPVFLGFPCGSADKESACNAGGLGSIPGVGRPPGEGKGYPFQYSGLENSMDSTVHGVAKNQTLVSDFQNGVPLFCWCCLIFWRQSSSCRILNWKKKRLIEKKNKYMTPFCFALILYISRT